MVIAGLRFDTSQPDDGQEGPGWSKDVKAGLVNEGGSPRIQWSDVAADSQSKGSAHTLAFPFFSSRVVTGERGGGCADDREQHDIQRDLMSACRIGAEGDERERQRKQTRPHPRKGSRPRRMVLQR